MRVATVTIVLLLTLGGCRTAERPAPSEPTRGATPEPSAPPSPAVPSAAVKHTPEGLAAFVRHYVETVDRASKTGDVEALRQLSADGCDGCQIYISKFESLYAAGGEAERDWSVGALDVRFHHKDDAESFVTTNLRIGGGSIRPATGAPPTTYPDRRARVSFGARFEDGTWVITQFGAGEVS